MKKRGLALLLTLVLLCQWGGILTVSAAGSSKGNAEAIVLDETVRPHLEKGTTHWYKITPDETQYYRFTFSNRSLEVRTGIGLADDLLNLFVGKMTVTIYDQYDTKLAVQDIRCGYEASISRLLQEGNTYYVTVTSSVSGNYFMTAKKLADIGGNSWQQATEILPTGQFASAIDAAGEKDWFCFRAGEERAYHTFSLENLNSGKKYFNLYEYVEGAGETPLRAVADFAVDNGTTNEVNLQLNSGSLYYYVIQSTSTGTGGYVMNTTEILDAAGNQKEDAYEVETKTSYISSLDGRGDVDWFAFQTADVDAYYHVNFDRLSGDSNVDVKFYDADGNELASTGLDRYGKACTTNVRLKPNSTYYVRFSVGYVFTTPLGNYTFSIDVKEDAYPNTREEAPEVAVEQTHPSSFDGHGDADWVSFTTAGNEAYYYVFFARFSGDSNVDVELYDADGNKIASTGLDRYGKECHLNAKLKPNTTYYIRLGVGYIFTNALGNYDFTIREEADAYPNTKEEAKLVEVNTEYTSTLTGKGDVDWVTFQTGDGNAYCTVNFNRTSGDTNVGVDLYDADGNKLAGASLSRYDKTCSASALLKPNSTYFLCVSMGYVYASADNNYTFTVSLKMDEDADQKEKATAITLGAKNERELQANEDVDWFTVEIATGGEYQIDTLNESCASLEGRLYTARDREMLYVNGTQKKNVTLEPGTYYLKIYGKKGYYTFTMRSLLPGDTNGDGLINGLDNKGDVDGDGTITSTDARLVLQFYAGKITDKSLNTGVADADGDGKITSTDARLILQKYAGKIKDFPV